MTRKDYVVIARMFKDSLDDSTILMLSPQTLKHTAQCMASIFEMDNPAFDRERFLKACGVQS